MTILLTPTEDLCMEVLTARHRLGENIWTFDSRHKPALKKLESRGLVNVIHGMVERSIRASLTEAGIKEYMDENYVAPVFRK